MNILIVNQSVIDMCASFFSLLTVVDTKMTNMSHDSAYDQFVCRFWLMKKPQWCMLVTSTYGIVIMTLSRYIAVIYPLRYKTVRIITIIRFLCKVSNLKRLETIRKSIDINNPKCVQVVTGKKTPRCKSICSLQLLSVSINPVYA